MIHKANQGLQLPSLKQQLLLKMEIYNSYMLHNKILVFNRGDIKMLQGLQPQSVMNPIYCRVNCMCL